MGVGGVGGGGVGQHEGGWGGGQEGCWHVQCNYKHSPNFIPTCS